MKTYRDLKIANIIEAIKSKKNRKAVILVTVFFVAMLVILETRKTIDFIPLSTNSMESVFKGLDLYDAHCDFSYPPFFACIVSLFRIFVFPIGLGLWNLFSVALLFLSLLLIIPVVKYGEPKEKEQKSNWSFDKKLYIIPTLLAVFILMDNLFLGQINLLVFFTLCACIYFYYNEKTHLLSGIFLAMGIAIKITPALFLIYFLYKRNWKVLYGAILGIFLFFLIIPSAFFGIERNLILEIKWFKVAIMPFLSGGEFVRGSEMYKHINQSIEAFFMRTLTDLPRMYYGGVYNYNPININPKIIRLITHVCRAAMLIVMAFLSKSNLKKNPQLIKYDFALLIMAILFISPLSWNNHYITVIFPYTVAFYYVINKYFDERNRNIMKNCLAAAVIFTMTGLSYYLQSFSGLFIGHLILWIGVAVVLHRENRIAKLSS